MKPIFIIGTIVLAAIIGAYFYFYSGETGPKFVIVKKGDIISEVSVTGRVKPFKNVDLAFEKSGRVSAVLADVGNFVGAGSVLVRQDSGEISASLLKAEADLNKSEITLQNYYSSIVNVANDAYTKADDAVRKQADSMFTDGESDTPKLSFSTTNSQAQTDSQNGRLASRHELTAWQKELSDLSAASSREELDSALLKSQNHLQIVKSFLLSVMDALDKATGITQATIDTYKAGITTARTNINTALTNITDQEQDINSQKASISSDKADVQNIEAQIAKTVLYAPISGIVTKQDAKVGEIAVANAILVSVISASQFEIEANIPEVDIAKVKVGDLANVTLDAYGSSIVFEAKVSAIDPAETVIEGVATYKTTLQFLKNDKRIKSGMTGNVDILSEKHSDVLIVPNRLVIEKNGGKFVVILENGNQKEVQVKTGLRDSDGNVEILEGLKEGDRIIISEK